MTAETIDGIELPTREEPLEPQGFVHQHRPSEARFELPMNRDDGIVKPKGGMWTSTLYEENGQLTNGWIDWCSAERWGLGGQQALYKVEPESHAHVLEIDSYTDLQRVLEVYRRDDLPDVLLAGTFAPLDFEALASGFDAIRLTEKGQRETRMTTPGLYGWDSECVLSLRWIWDECEVVRDIDPDTEYEPPFHER